MGLCTYEHRRSPYPPSATIFPRMREERFALANVGQVRPTLVEYNKPWVGNPCHLRMLAAYPKPMGGPPVPRPGRSRFISRRLQRLDIFCCIDIPAERVHMVCFARGAARHATIRTLRKLFEEHRCSKN